MTSRERNEAGSAALVASTKRRGRSEWAAIVPEDFGWLHNGQPIGPQGPSTTEDGAYAVTSLHPIELSRKPGALFFVPSVDEWYKAAFYQPSGTYRTSVVTAPLCGAPGPGGLGANCGGVVGTVINVRSYPNDPGP